MEFVAQPYAHLEPSSGHKKMRMEPVARLQRKTPLKQVGFQRHRCTLQLPTAMPLLGETCRSWQPSRHTLPEHMPTRMAENGLPVSPTLCCKLVPPALFIATTPGPPHHRVYLAQAKSGTFNHGNYCRCMCSLAFSQVLPSPAWSPTKPSLPPQPTVPCLPAIFCLQRRSYFDSAEYFLDKQGLQPQDIPVANPEPNTVTNQLPMKLQPCQHVSQPSRLSVRT